MDTPLEPFVKKRSTLYIQVLVAIVIGVLVGHFWPETGVTLRPFGDGFIKLVKMLIAPIIFTTVAVGLAGMGDLKRAGRVGTRALIYFEVLTTFALILGLIVSNVFQPGAGMHAVPTEADMKAVAQYTNAAKEMHMVDFFLHIIPNTFVSAFVDGELLQVLLLALLFGVALARLGDHGRSIMNLINAVSRVMFGIVSIVTKLAPIAAFGAMAFTVGRYGLGSLVTLAKLMACVYFTCALFIFVVLGIVARMAGFRLLKILKLIREELLIVLGTSSSESALPMLMDRLEKVGCQRSVVGIVLPAGYSFNLDGTCIYLTMAALFVAQATDTSLTLSHQIALLLTLLITSKGASGVVGSGFIVLAATLSISKDIPVAGMALILGIDRFMAEARALTNFIGNAVGTLVIARWEGAFDESKAVDIMASPKS
jgi:aerobic C4-dicarboxylate transport protein